MFGVPDTIRTCDLQSRSLSLYPAELQAHAQHGYYSLGGGVCQWEKGGFQCLWPVAGRFFLEKKEVVKAVTRTMPTAMARATTTVCMP